MNYFSEFGGRGEGGREDDSNKSNEEREISKSDAKTQLETKSIKEQIQELKLSKREKKLFFLLAEYLEGGRSEWMHNPGKFAVDLKNIEMMQPKEYKKFIPFLEKICLEKMNILEDYQIMLRGDCGNYDDIIKKTKRENLSAVRNRRYHLDTEERKKLALGCILAEIISRSNLAKRAKETYGGKPVIMYDFQKWEKGFEDADFREYFVGHTDDMGIPFDNPRFLSLPNISLFPAIYPFSSKGSEKYIPSRSDIKRMDWFSERGLEDGQLVFHTFLLMHPESYVHALLFTYTMLSEGEKEQKKSA